jgi:hypothetical protein
MRHIERCTDRPPNHGATSAAMLCALCAWIPVVGLIGLCFSCRSAGTLYDRRMWWGGLWLLAVGINAAGVLWTLLYLSLRLGLVSGLY